VQSHGGAVKCEGVFEFAVEIKDGADGLVLFALGGLEAFRGHNHGIGEEAPQRFPREGTAKNLRRTRHLGGLISLRFMVWGGSNFLQNLTTITSFFHSIQSARRSNRKVGHENPNTIESGASKWY
jgi:hypothetical protein